MKISQFSKSFKKKLRYLFFVKNNSHLFNIPPVPHSLTLVLLTNTKANAAKTKAVSLSILVKVIFRDVYLSVHLQRVASMFNTTRCKQVQVQLSTVDCHCLAPVEQVTGVGSSKVYVK